MTITVKNYAHCDLITIPEASAHTAAIGIWLQNGARWENNQQTGYAHFLEHLVFKRTHQYSGQELSVQFERMGGDINAETGRELTAFHGHVPHQYASRCLQLFIDMLTRPAFDQGDFDIERGVVLQELAMLNDDPEEALEDFATEQVWGEHSMGQQILGTRHTLQQSTLESMHAYINGIRQRSRLIVAACGRIDIDELEQACAAIDWPDTQQQDQTAPAFSTCNRSLELDCEQTHLQWLMPAVAYSDPATPVYDIANHILAGGYDSRLYQALREQHGLVYSISSRVDFYSDTGLWFIQTNTEPDQAGLAQSIVSQVLDELICNGPTHQELEDAREHLQSSMILEHAGLESRLENAVRDTLYLGHIPGIEAKCQAYSEVTLDDVRHCYSQAWQRASLFTAN